MKTRLKVYCLPPEPKHELCSKCIRNRLHTYNDDLKDIVEVTTIYKPTESKIQGSVCEKYYGEDDGNIN